MTDPDGKIYSYGYDVNNNLTDVIYPDGSTRTYHYEYANFPNHLTGITDENGNRFAIFSYDSNGKAVSTEHAQTDGSPQERFALAYDTETQTTVTDPINEQWIYTFSENLGVNNPIRIVNKTDGKGITQQFDANNNLISHVDEEGRTTTHTYNTDNQRISTTKAVGTPQERTRTYEYVSNDIDLLARIVSPSVLNGSTQEVVTTYDANLNVTSITHNGFVPTGMAVSRTTNFQYNSLRPGYPNRWPAHRRQ